ncbi:MAG TPA: ABC transporter permease, partial [Candidatus Dormibacteraeota bacterium]|nr:ABC transporter permease [Candidatus Dormibacteraeota bacterium]
MMLRAVWLTIGKEFLLIRRDRVGLFMLILAPIAVIAAAGFSLAKIYGGRTASRGGYTIAVVDEDHGAIGRAILDAIGRQPGLAIIRTDDGPEAEDLVRRRKLAVVGIVIPKGTTQAIEHGEKARLVLYTDPVKYLQTIKIELMIADLCREVTSAAADQARKQTL